MKGGMVSVIVDDPRKDALQAPSPRWALDVLEGVADGASAMRNPVRATIPAAHPRSLPDPFVPGHVRRPSGGRIAASGGQGPAPELGSRDRRGAGDAAARPAPRQGPAPELGSRDREWTREATARA